ncbi:DUF1328 domain-containing protein [Legionella jordanis]|uniref:Transmembrane protein n=1 Tax=Legionella jordanis TaxID=456 RepID=A0A0W0V7K7_9GAMM|nr:DUF1328 domain-containing protein [Legionella jordanis]KTD16101.1 transmembrane protein [Legionella jordanis]VEH12439.1 transmembrane protein [Legionella jordanis]
MLAGSLFFLLIGIIAAIFAYRRRPSTLSHVAKILFYFSLLIFVVLLFASIFSNAPPQPHTSALPI